MGPLSEVLKCVQTMNDFFYCYKDVRNKKRGGIWNNETEGKQGGILFVEEHLCEWAAFTLSNETSFLSIKVDRNLIEWKAF